jgi:phosphinothricin acetyltransferase
MIRNVIDQDAKQIASVYNYYVNESINTFETIPIDETEMLSRIRSIKENYPFIVFEKDKRIIAYAYAARWKTRQAYDLTVESSVYVDAAYHGKGIATSLYKILLDQLKKKGFHSVLAGISMPNDTSIHLHEKLGFVYSGTLKEVGLKFGKWIDVAYWNLLL